MVLSSIYYNNGYFCASHPLEIIIGTITIATCLLSAGFIATKNRICGWNYFCGQNQTDDGSELMLLSVTRCLAVIYIYLQYRNIKQHRSKYLLGISGSLMITSSFLFMLVFIKVIGGDITLITEALPFFLLLLDLSKACAVAKHALKSRTHEDIQNNIAEGISVVAPAITLDSICELLVIGVGTLSGVKQLQSVCCYGCLFVVAHYIAFMIFYPACLSLILEITRTRNHGKAFLHLQKLARGLDNEEDKKPNPVIQHIKIIMSAGLIIVHLHSQYTVDKGNNSQFSGLLTTRDMMDSDLPQETTPVHFLVRMFTRRIDYTFMFVLGVFLTIKHMFFADHVEEEFQRDIEEHSQIRSRQISDTLRDSESQTIEPVKDMSTDETDFQRVIPKVNISHAEDNKQVQFSMGDNSDSDEENKSTDIGVQTEIKMFKPLQRLPSRQPPRPIEECLEILNSDAGPSQLTDEEVVMLVKARHIPAYKLEITLNDFERGVSIRREMLSSKLENTGSLDNLPYSNYSYEYVNGACCENVIGYMPVPVGVAGPLLLDGKYYHVPMATTEGCLVASTNRGCRALEQSGGVTSVIINDGMTRAPVVRFPSACRASTVKKWLEDVDNFDKIEESFNTTSRFARLKRLQTVQAGKLLYIRFIAVTGDAMGMNMLSKGAEKALGILSAEFPDMEVLSLSGNFCTDKKPAAVNWLEGRGKSVVCEAIIPSHIVKNVLKTSVEALVDLNINKNLVGSAMAGSMGGFNAHAANVVTAIFIATGQDPAQNVTSSNCITLMEAVGEDKSDLFISCTMPSIEVGTIGGGTVLPPQAACLEMLGVCGSCSNNPGENAKILASVICGAVLAGELSLMSALAAGHLVRSHLKHNRSTINVSSNPSSSSLASPPSMLSKSSENPHRLLSCIRDNDTKHTRNCVGQQNNSEQNTSVNIGCPSDSVSKQCDKSSKDNTDQLRHRNIQSGIENNFVKSHSES